MGNFNAPHIWLASRRLAILGLGPLGDQPLVDDASGVVLVYNGEVYNYLELRQQLQGLGHRFAGSSDSEVLLRCYLQWGPDCARRLNGMWALAIWDPRTQAVHLCRDRFGVKPLFWTRSAQRVAFASEPKVLLKLFPELRVPNDESIADLLAYNRVLSSDSSFYQGIDVFPAAHWATVTTASFHLSLHRYWSVPSAVSPAEMPLEDAYGEFGSLFDDSIRLRLRSDVPVGVTLSGGLDSTAVFNSVRKALDEAKPVVAYTSVYTGHSGSAHDESSWARQAIAGHPPSELREVPVLEDEWLSTLRKIVWHMDGPGFSPAVVPLWGIARQAREDGIKVLIEGQGADESLGGYSWHLAASFVDRACAALSHPTVDELVAVRSLLQEGVRQFSAKRLVADVLGVLSSTVLDWDRRRKSLAGAIRSDARSSPKRVRALNGQSRLANTLLADFTSALLPGFLHYGDAVMMAQSVENRLPFLDYRLVEHIFRMPSEYKTRRGESKAPLRAYLRTAGQVRIASRKRKEGYPTPTNEWMAAQGGAILRPLLSKEAHVGGYVDRHRLSRAIDAHAAGNYAAGESLFALLSTELWLQECF
jgi:asparagine synthase (glutamine-hydrolysing)